MTVRLRPGLHGPPECEAIRASARGGRTKIYRGTASGIRSDRPQPPRLLKQVEPGDIVVVMRLDKLARSTLDLLRPCR